MREKKSRYPKAMTAEKHAAAGTSGGPLGIYLHIPFCERKCRYCGFLSFVPSAADQPHRYAQLLAEEMKLHAVQARAWDAKTAGETATDACGRHAKGHGRQPVDSVFFGGGTPSLLAPEDLLMLLDQVRRCFPLTDDCEITVETNPESLTRSKIEALLAGGVNRFSIGMQSLRPASLAVLGRIHDRERALRAYRDLREAGAANINIDLMFAYPGHQAAAWQEDLKEVVALQPDHISAYSLQLEEGSAFYRDYKAGRIDLPEDAQERAMYHQACRFLASKGYAHYEISNWAAQGKACRHNMKYWRMRPFLGLGLGASSFYQSARYRNFADPARYEKALLLERLPIERIEEQADAAAADPLPGLCVEAARNPEPLWIQEDIYCMTALRTRRGILYAEFSALFGEAFASVYDAVDYRRWIAQGFLEETEQGLALTVAGIDRSNEIMADFLRESAPQSHAAESERRTRR